MSGLWSIRGDMGFELGITDERRGLRSPLFNVKYVSD